MTDTRKFTPEQLEKIIETEKAILDAFDETGHHIKKIVLTIEAGEVPTVQITRLVKIDEVDKVVKVTKVAEWKETKDATGHTR